MTCPFCKGEGCEKCSGSGRITVVVGERMYIQHVCRVPWTRRLAFRYGSYRAGPGLARLNRLVGKAWWGINLLPPSPECGAWSADAATANWVAFEIQPPAVLLGARVAAAAGFAGAGVPSKVCGYVIFPHPSGRSRLWNEPGMEEACREVFDES